MGLCAIAVCEFGVPPRSFWKMTPQEFWACWALKYGTRKTRSTQFTNEEVKDMRAYLDEQLAKEGQLCG